MSRVAIIPARGGSKRIPRKNLREFLGRPMIAYPIALARGSGLFDRVVVSTDDDEIAALASEEGAEVPFRRPDDLANDHAGTRPVIEHAIRALEHDGDPVALVCCLYPCTPLLEEGDLRAALAMLDTLPADRFVISLAAFPSAIERALRRDGAGHAHPVDPAMSQKRTQDLEPAYYDAGQFYAGRREAWLGPRAIFDGAGSVVLPASRAVDIDTEEDWAMAERFAQLRGA